MKRALFSLLLLTACNGGGPSIDAAPPGDATWSPKCYEAMDHSDFAWIEENVFRGSCASFMSCHDSQNPAGGLDLTAGNAYGELVNVPSFYFTDWMRVTPGDPEASYLMVRLRCTTDEDPYVAQCESGPLDGGVLMPPNSAPVCKPKREAIRRWIEQGALDN